MAPPTTPTGARASRAARTSVFFERLRALAPASKREDEDEDEDGGRFGRRKPSGKAAARAKRKASKAASLRPNGSSREGEEDGSDGSDGSESASEEDAVDDAARGVGCVDGGGEGEDVEAPATSWRLEKSSEDKLEALRERLRKKIESSRSARKAAESAETVRDAKEWRERRKAEKRERKRKEKANATLAEARKGAKKLKSADGEDDGGSKAGKTNDMAFGRIKMDDVELNTGRKKKKESKESLLRKVQARQKAIEDAGGEEGGGKAVAEKFAWEAALSRASGEKVLDDPKLLQKSIKREARAKKKSREKWEERTAKVQEQMNAAQTKRKNNLKARKDGKIERKMDKASGKRNRPGFEGRSDGFINK